MNPFFLSFNEVVITFLVILILVFWFILSFNKAKSNLRYVNMGLGFDSEKKPQKFKHGSNTILIILFYLKQ